MLLAVPSGARADKEPSAEVLQTEPAPPPEVFATAFETGATAAITYTLAAAGVATLFASSVAFPATFLFSLPLGPAVLLLPPLVSAVAAGLAASGRLPWWGALATGAGTMVVVGLATVPIAGAALGLVGLTGFELGIPIGLAVYAIGPGLLAAGAGGLLGASFAGLAGLLAAEDDTGAPSPPALEMR